MRSCSKTPLTMSTFLHSQPSCRSCFIACPAFLRMLKLVGSMDVSLPDNGDTLNLRIRRCGGRRRQSWAMWLSRPAIWIALGKCRAILGGIRRKRCINKHYHRGSGRYLRTYNVDYLHKPDPLDSPASIKATPFSHTVLITSGKSSCPLLCYAGGKITGLRSSVHRICMFVRTLVHKGMGHRDLSNFFQRNLIPLILFLVDMAWIFFVVPSPIVDGIDGIAQPPRICAGLLSGTKHVRVLTKKVGSGRIVEGRAMFEGFAATATRLPT